MDRKTRTRRPTPRSGTLPASWVWRSRRRSRKDVTPSAALHAERRAPPPKSPKPAGMATSEWYAQRTRNSDVSAAALEEAEDVDEGEVEAVQFQSWGSGLGACASRAAPSSAEIHRVANSARPSPWRPGTAMSGPGGLVTVRKQPHALRARLSG